MYNMQCTGRNAPGAGHGSSMPVPPGSMAHDMNINHAHNHVSACGIYNIGPATACILPVPSPHPNPAASDGAAAGYPWRPNDGSGPAGRAVRSWGWLGC